MLLVVWAVTHAHTLSTTFGPPLWHGTGTSVGHTACSLRPLDFLRAGGKSRAFRLTELPFQSWYPAGFGLEFSQCPPATLPPVTRRTRSSHPPDLPAWACAKGNRHNTGFLQALPGENAHDFLHRHVAHRAVRTDWPLLISPSLTPGRFKSH